MTGSVRIESGGGLSVSPWNADTEIVTKALIVIDAQESFRQRPGWDDFSHPDIVGSINRLVALARANDDLVVWVLHSAPGSADVFDPAGGHVRLLDGLEAADDEPTITKTVHNAFTSTNLQQTLTDRSIRDLQVCGIRTEQCCETTTRVGSDLGFAMTFVTDATSTSPLPHWRTGVVLPTEDIIARTEYALAERFATIATVAELTGIR